MNLNVKIKNIGLKDISSLDFICRGCNYWFECSKVNIFEEFRRYSKFSDFLRSKLIEIKNNHGKEFEAFFNSGGKIKIASVNDNEVKGVVVYGNYYLFPRLREFNVYPPDDDSNFIACMFVDPCYRDFGVGERLLLSIEKDSLESGIFSLESIAKRQNDNISDKEYENLHLAPFKFLIKNGFLIKKNDECFPLLRIDLTTIETVLSKKESLFARLFAKKQLSRSTMIKITTERNELKK